MLCMLCRCVWNDWYGLTRLKANVGVTTVSCLFFVVVYQNISLYSA